MEQNPSSVSSQHKSWSLQAQTRPYRSPTSCKVLLLLIAARCTSSSCDHIAQVLTPSPHRAQHLKLRSFLTVASTTVLWLISAMEDGEQQRPVWHVRGPKFLSTGRKRKKEEGRRRGEEKAKPLCPFLAVSRIPNDTI